MHNYHMSDFSENLFHHTFETIAGFCTVAWKDSNLRNLFLPEMCLKSHRQRVMHALPGSAEQKSPSFYLPLIRQIKAYFNGKVSDFGQWSIELDGQPVFYRQVFETLRTIPAGRILSYKDLAEKCGNHSAARAVGQAVRNNPLPLIIPCHRVICSDGRLGGFTAAEGLQLKIRMLEIEGLEVISADRPFIRPPMNLSEISISNAVEELSEKDRELGIFIRSAPVFNLRPDAMNSPFQALLEAIVYQQLTGKAAATIFSRLLAVFGKTRSVSPLDIIRAGDPELRAAGLSGAKIAAARDLAEFAASGQLPSLEELQKMHNADIISTLTQIRGIGRWTVEMLLIFKLGRADIVAADDYGLRKGLAAIRGMQKLPSPAILLEQSKKWKPYGTIASWYLWRAAENFNL